MATFSGNPAADPLTGVEIVPITQGGVDKRTTTQAIADLAASDESVQLITEAGAATLDPATHSGRNRLILAGGDLTLNTAESYSAGDVFNIYATATIDILLTGVTLTPPNGGSEQLEAAMAVSIVMTGTTTAIMFGQTVPSS